MKGLRVHLELTNICNLNCAFCPKPVMKRKSGFMDKRLAIRLMDELSEGGLKIDKLFFHLMGEPILHPDFLELAKYAITRKLPLSIYSNGSRLKPDMVRFVLELNPPELVISVQTPDKETFALRKDTLSYGEYCDNIKDLILEKVNSRADTRIELRILNTRKDNIFSPRYWLVDRKSPVTSGKDKIKYFLETLNQKLQGSRVCFDTEKILSGVSLSSSGFRIPLSKDTFLAGTTYFSWYNFEDARLAGFKRAHLGGCDAFRRQLAILWDGSVTSCCVDYDGENSVGNVSAMTLKEVLRNENTSMFKASFRRCILPTAYCRICRGAMKIRVWLAKQIGSIFIYNFLNA